jgi:hypothetical protein
MEIGLIACPSGELFSQTYNLKLTLEQPEVTKQIPSQSPKKRGIQVNNFGLQDPHRFTTGAFDPVGTRFTGS